MSSRPRYTQETFEAILGRLQAAPAAPVPRNYSTAGLVRALAPKIREMTKKGYAWEDIARMLGDDGVALSANLLRKYVSESLDKTRAKKKASIGRKQDETRLDPAPAKSSNLPRPTTAPAPVPPPRRSEFAAKTTSSPEPTMPSGRLMTRSDTTDL